MAEKGFGVKEINLIGASGTPTIESPNNLNLNAVNVAISTNVSIGGTLSVTGNVSVGGTLTYEDVTNIDSVGLITARSGLIISGVTTFHNDVEFKTSGTTIALLDHSQSRLEFQDNMAISFGNHPDVEIFYSNGNDFNIIGQYNGSGDLVTGFKNNAGNILKSFNAVRSDGSAELYFSNSKKLATTNTGATVTGTLAATAVTGDGSGLTNLPAATPTTSDIQVAYELLNTSSSSNGYRISGNGTNSSTNNPDLYLIRGQKYRFINNSGGSHPFRIQSDNSSTLYSTGVTNNNASSGNIDFAPTYDSPAHLYYKCGNHPSMLGNIYLRGGSGNETNVGVTSVSTLHTNKILPVGGAPSGSNGGIVQVKYVMSDTQQNFGNTSNSYQNITNLALAFTPVRSDSIIHVRTTFNVHVYTDQNWDEAFATFKIYDSTNNTTLNETAVTNRWGNSNNQGRIQCDVTMDAFVAASNTNARTYQVQVKTRQSGYYAIVMPDYAYESGGSRDMNSKGHLYAYEISS